ncbi:uncharacterized protein VP01_14125g1, partial [Puccinia sorghi]
DVLDWRSAEDELDLEYPQIDAGSFFPNPRHNVEYSSSDTPNPQLVPTKKKPGFDLVLTSEIAPKNISSSMDETNILHNKRRANLTRALVASEIPRTYREAMLSSDTSNWSCA